jgi:EAL domain-containing protein (putative c-di-GMP-specific phosphodiesterase class I)
VIVRSTVDLGHNLGLKVVAEGVESAESYRRLQELGCDIVQGYHLGRPTPPSAISAMQQRSGVKNRTSARRPVTASQPSLPQAAKR